MEGTGTGGATGVTRTCGGNRHRWVEQGQVGGTGTGGMCHRWLGGGRGPLLGH